MTPFDPSTWKPIGIPVLNRMETFREYREESLGQVSSAGIHSYGFNDFHEGSTVGWDDF